MIGTRSGPGRLTAALAALWLAVGMVVPANAGHGNAATIGINNMALLKGLTPAQQAAVARAGFVVTSPTPMGNTKGIDTQTESPSAYTAAGQLELQHAVYWQFSSLYGDNYAHQIPTFVTSDAMLHTFHVIYDQTLKTLERTIFTGRLEALSKGMMDVATFQYGAAKDPQTKEAARLNLGYMAVAQRLLDPSATTPTLVAPQVSAELALIAAHHGQARSPLFGATVDYSQFVPRGHYTSSDALRRYFLAMTWYGRLSFPLQGANATLRTRQALLLVRGLTMVPDLGKLWSAVFDPITTWVGQSDDLTVRDYQQIAARVYPANAPVSALADNAHLARFIALASKLPGPQIRDENGTTPSFRLFGQRFVPDAAIMQALIFPNVGTRQQPRIWPMGLDVAATLGSARATNLLTGSLDQARYTHYAQQLSAQQRQYQALPSSTWDQNLYWGWLSTLRAVWGQVPSAAPAFMKTDAWGDKRLATGLGSWAELRHDTLLYVKQPYGLGAGGQPPLRVAYVEPVPLVYTRLLALTQQLKATLVRSGAMATLNALPSKLTAFPSDIFAAYIPTGDTGVSAALDGFAGLVAVCERVSERELLNQTVSAGDLNTLTDIGGYLSTLTDYFNYLGNGRYLTPFDKQVAAIADVFTEPISGQVLEEGVGDVLPIYAVVTVNGKPWLARGGVFSYYEFHQPAANRLTDDAWRRLPERPPLPTWSQSYIAH